MSSLCNVSLHVPKCGRAGLRSFAVRAHIDSQASTRLLECSTNVSARYDLLGLGQAMCDFSGVVTPDFLASKNLAPGGRRCANCPVSMPRTF
jgi:hypothetical protein